MRWHKLCSLPITRSGSYQGRQRATGHAPHQHLGECARGDECCAFDRDGAQPRLPHGRNARLASHRRQARFAEREAAAPAEVVVEIARRRAASAHDGVQRKRFRVHSSAIIRAVMVRHNGERLFAFSSSVAYCVYAPVVLGSTCRMQDSRNGPPTESLTCWARVRSPPPVPGTGHVAPPAISLAIVASISLVRSRPFAI
jgi:hypothetical protein